MAKSKITPMKKNIETIKGSANILLIAPHGYPDDDENTGEVARLMAKRLGCYAVINEVYRKPEEIEVRGSGEKKWKPSNKAKKIVNLNRRKQVEKYLKAEFLQPILNFTNEILSSHGKAFVFWIHGIDDENLESEIQQMKVREDIHVLVGIGQGKIDSPTAYPKTVDWLCTLLKGNDHKRMEARLARIGSRYCGQHQDVMNQFFIQEGHTLSKVQSVQLEIKNEGFRDTAENIPKTADAFSDAIIKLVAALDAGPGTIKEVKLADIQMSTKDDYRYIFRVTAEDQEFKQHHKEEIEELADSIKNDGLVHPLVLLETKDGTYKLLCGFRRYEALKRLKKQQVEARVYPEGELTEEECLGISFAENTKRRNLNAVEIGAFLQAARGEGKSQKSLGQLGQEYGEILDIGTSHGSVDKYLRLNQIRESKESPDIINDVLNGKLQFGVAAEVLGFIKDPEDRNALHGQIVRPFKPTRPELKEIKKLLEQLDPSIKRALAKKEVKHAVKEAENSEATCQELITQLRFLIKDPLVHQKKTFQDQVDSVRKEAFAKEATPEDFNIIPPSDMEKNEVTVQFKITDDNFDEVSTKVKKLLGKKGKLRELLNSIVSP